MRRSRHRVPAAVTVASYVGTFTAGFGACALLFASAANRVAAPGPPPPTPHARLADSAGPAAYADARTVRGGNERLVADAVARVGPSVVNIDVSSGSAAAGPFAYLRPGARGGEEGAGSGIVLTADGFVATNNHVVASALGENGRIVVRLPDGREFRSVAVVGRDPASDLAVLKISGARGLTPATLGDSDRLRVGDWAIAVGNPLGYNSTVTLGIVSALNRRGFRVEEDAFDTVIQTDAAINPGSSGGALADAHGEVVGINSAIHTPTGTNVGIGFAIPINHARRILDELIARGRVTRAYLGVVYQPLDSIDREVLRKGKPGLRLPAADRPGALVISGDPARPAVAPGSPAARAGIRAYDILLEVAGRPVDDIDRVQAEVLRRRPGDRLSLLVWRSGKEIPVTVTLEEMPDGYLSRQRR